MTAVSAVSSSAHSSVRFVALLDCRRSYSSSRAGGYLIAAAASLIALRSTARNQATMEQQLDVTVATAVAIAAVMISVLLWSWFRRHHSGADPTPPPPPPPIFPRGFPGKMAAFVAEIQQGSARGRALTMAQATARLVKTKDAYLLRSPEAKRTCRAVKRGELGERMEGMSGDEIYSLFVELFGAETAAVRQRLYWISG
jgi:hypothetical protein